jgi:two-component system, chemotaxis family, sensor kinase CheA
MSIDMSQFYQVFFEESAEHLAAMEGLLLDLDLDNPDSEQLNAIFRAAHSIKGSAATFGFTDLANTTHILESLLDRIRKHELNLCRDMVDAFLQSGDLLRGMLEAHQGRGAVDQAAVDQLLVRLRQLSTGLEEEATPPTTADTGSVVPVGGGPGPIAVKRIFEIQFVPTAVSAAGAGVANLLEALRAVGELEILSKPEAGIHDVGYWQLRLQTDVGTEEISDQIDFIAESGAWRVVEDKGGLAVEADSLSESDADDGALLDDAAGYGLFPSGDHSIASSSDLEGADREAGYGFFEPLPESLPGAALSEQIEEGGGAYGFFAPLNTEEGPALEEGDGFGFFVPISPPVSTDVPAAEPAISLALAESLLPAPADGKSAVKSVKQAAVADSSIRVSVEKVDQLINLVGELVITQAMLLQAVTEMQDDAPEQLLGGLTQLERNTRDLQESVMSIRMMPISFVFSRFPRVVRDLSSKLGKQVVLKTSGETTELDKNLIERIADPLTHLIRNSLDHGIELPDSRVAAGKSPIGTITLKAYHQGGNVVVEVGDDGAGLPRHKILAKARERGLPVSDQMTDAEVYGLIFEAGFSTAEQVTDVSGRGVGMDVVRRNIQSMGGRVEIESMLGVGTRMTVRLPLTLAILDGMSIAVGDQTYILPLSYVMESFQPGAGDIKTLSNQARVTHVRGEYLPVIVLHELFNIRHPSVDFTRGIMVVIEADGIRAALFVDALVGQHQVVIKSLEANYRRVPGVSGATIMGDGHVALILDVSAIAGMARGSMQKAG